MIPPKQKVLAYITRSRPQGVELLVFKHRDFPDAGIQVPAGTVDAGESHQEAVNREVMEESGLILKGAARSLGAFEYLRPETNELQIQNVFQVSVEHDVPDRWSHTVSGHDEDEKMVFEFYWLDARAAAAALAVNQGDYVSYI